MREFARSVWTFAKGIGRRLYALIPGVVLGVASTFDAFIKPYLPPEWQAVSLAVPLSWVLIALFLGCALAAVLTFHELRMAAASSKPLIVVESGGVYVENAENVTMTGARGSGSKKIIGSRQDSDGQTSIW